MRNIEFDVKISDLHYIRYEFWLKDGKDLFLDKMIVLKKETKRHKLRVIFEESYSRLLRREFGIKEEPDLDIEIQLEALRIARENIKFKKWSDR